MKGIAVRLISVLLTFLFGVGASSLRSWTTHPAQQNQIRVWQALSENNLAPPSIEPGVEKEMILGGGRLRIVSEEVRLKSERLRYEIDVTYPQIIGSDERHIRRLNQHLEELATKAYAWPLHPSKADLEYYRNGPFSEFFNRVDLDYEVSLASDTLLSIYFKGYSYGIGAGHAVEYCLVVNYDLQSKKQLTLSEVFKPNLNYRQILTTYCREELTRKVTDEWHRSLEGETLEKWGVTARGIVFTFEECTIFSCAEGEQRVEIPFTVLRPLLKSGRSLTALADSSLGETASVLP
jgi:hypothetical protein